MEKFTQNVQALKYQTLSLPPSFSSLCFFSTTLYYFPLFFVLPLFPLLFFFLSSNPPSTTKPNRLLSLNIKTIKAQINIIQLTIIQPSKLHKLEVITMSISTFCWEVRAHK
ncbi:hypothetical protein RchiOBHm_Chr2g0118281 [Rosa chinensis]|uniref:Transmembrane protein n=1 Tax=Rosa chinensis TaxID=74649 RepID=A0A2P6RRQ8_ROSCH|nr:hypothetical protein RchiOBHm_Chr2g0118281 [Rosa chinensis]